MANGLMMPQGCPWICNPQLLDFASVCRVTMPPHRSEFIWHVGLAAIRRALHPLSADDQAVHTGSD